MRLITRAVSQNVLIAQFRTNLCGDVRQLVRIRYFKRTATGQFCHFIEQSGPIEFLRRSITVVQGVKNADRVQLGICFSHESPDIALVVSAMVISSVGYDEQSPFAVSSGLHLAEAQIDPIEERSATFRRGRE